MVVADDLGYGDVTPAGTPNLHALATNGSRFLQFSVASPVCSPSRAGYLTGHWPARHGIHQAFGTRANGVSYGMPAFLDPAAVSLPRLLRSAGFATAHFGKWHLTANDVARAPHPQEYGYDEYKGFNGPPGTAESDVAEIWEDALGFLRRRGEKPAFVVLAAHQPHTPHRPSAAALARFAGERKEQRRVYAAVVSELDEGVGTLLRGLRRQAEWWHSLLLFFSDNGPEHASNEEKERVRRKCRGPEGGERRCTLVCGKWCSVGQTSGLRGRKRSLFEGGVASPFFVSWPEGGVPRRYVDATTVLNAVDLLPTLCAVARAPLPRGYVPDGEDVTPALRGAPPAATRAAPLHWEWQSFGHTQHTKDLWPWLAVRDGEWKLLLASDRARRSLFHLGRDRGEQRDLAQEEPQVAERLARLALAWQASLPRGRLPNRTV